MPGCAGDYMNPILEWILKGYSCNDCAWNNICKEFTDENEGKRISDTQIQLEPNIQNSIPK